MVSALWKACAAGDAAEVGALLKDATPVDVEVKDHTGVTPLIQAIRYGHVEVVKMLLEHGADPANGSSSGRPDNYTSDPAILDLLAAAAAKNAASAPAPGAALPPPPPPMHANGPVPYAPYGPDGYPAYELGPDGAPKAYYGAPMPMAYPPYYAPPPPPPADGSVPPQNGPPMAFYPVPPPPPPGPQPDQPVGDGSEQYNGSGGNNLPPPHVARAIPCRYYPACRYGSSCMFLHPQTPFFPGPLPPPAQYPAPAFDPQAAAFAQGAYYPVPPGAYPPPPPGAVYASPPGPHPTSPRHGGHSRAASEMMSPMAVPPAALPPVHMVPYGMPAPPMSPYGVQAGLPHMGPPPPHLLASPPNVASPQMFPVSAPLGSAQLPPMSPFHTRRESISSYHPDFASPVIPAGAIPVAGPVDPALSPKSPLQRQVPVDGFPGGPHHVRDGSVHRPRGARASISGGRGKPPCLFFPSGRCRNGDQCRFPHVLPDPNAPANGAPPARFGKGPRASMSSIESKLATLGLRDDAGAPNGHKANGFPNGSGFRGNATGNGNTNGARRSPPPKPQRVPVAEDFPVLTGSRTPPLQPNGHVNGVAAPSGPTAAQVLRAPAPLPKDKTPAPEVSKPVADGEAKTLDAVSPEVKVSA